MTTTTKAKPTPQTAAPQTPDLLFDLIIALLAPIFLGVTAGDVALARLAARETVNAYRAQNQAALIAVAQIIAFGLAALGSLSLSMADDLSLSMTLRLRGNANALNRAAEQNRKALTGARRHSPEPPAPEPQHPAEADIRPDSEPFLSAQAEQYLAAEAQARLDEEPARLAIAEPQAAPANTAERRDQEMWAIALASEASEITASLPILPPDQQQPAIERAGKLSSAAHNLLYGPPKTPLELIAILGMVQQDHPHS